MNQRTPASVPYARSANNHDSFLTGPSSRHTIGNNRETSSHNQFRTCANCNGMSNYNNRNNINQRQFGGINAEFVRSSSVNANSIENRNPTLQTKIFHVVQLTRS